MNYQLWIKDVEERLSQLEKKELGYPIGDNVVVTKSDPDARVGSISSGESGRQVSEFFSLCDGLSWPDVRNGYFVEKPAEEGELQDEYKPTEIEGQLDGKVALVGSTGSGALFVVRAATGEVLLLPAGLIEKNVYDNTDGRVRVLSSDFDGFLELIAGDLNAFLAGEASHPYIA